MNWTKTNIEALVTFIKTIPSVAGNAVEVFSQQDIETAKEQLRKPFVVVFYAGRKRAAQPMATVAQFGVGAVGLDRCCDPEGAVRDKTTEILDDLLWYVGRTKAAATGHAYEFERETPITVDGESVAYEQLWSTRVNVGQRPT